MRRKKHTLGKIRAGSYNYRGHCIHRRQYTRSHFNWVRLDEHGQVFDMTRTLGLMCRRVDKQEREEMRRMRDSFAGYRGA